MFDTDLQPTCSVSQLFIKFHKLIGFLPPNADTWDINIVITFHDNLTDAIREELKSENYSIPPRESIRTQDQQLDALNNLRNDAVKAEGNVLESCRTVDDRVSAILNDKLASIQATFANATKQAETTAANLAALTQAPSFASHAERTISMNLPANQLPPEPYRPPPNHNPGTADPNPRTLANGPPRHMRTPPRGWIGTCFFCWQEDHSWRQCPHRAIQANWDIFRTNYAFMRPLLQQRRQPRTNPPNYYGPSAPAPTISHRPPIPPATLPPPAAPTLSFAAPTPPTVPPGLPPQLTNLHQSGSLHLAPWYQPSRAFAPTLTPAQLASPNPPPTSLNDDDEPRRRPTAPPAPTRPQRNSPDKQQTSVDRLVDPTLRYPSLPHQSSIFYPRPPPRSHSHSNSPSSYRPDYRTPRQRTVDAQINAGSVRYMLRRQHWPLLPTLRHQQIQTLNWYILSRCVTDRILFKRSY